MNIVLHVYELGVTFAANKTMLFNITVTFVNEANSYHLYITVHLYSCKFEPAKITTSVTHHCLHCMQITQNSQKLTLHSVCAAMCNETTKYSVSMISQHKRCAI